MIPCLVARSSIIQKESTSKIKLVFAMITKEVQHRTMSKIVVADDSVHQRNSFSLLNQASIDLHATIVWSRDMRPQIASSLLDSRSGGYSRGIGRQERQWHRRSYRYHCCRSRTRLSVRWKRRMWNVQLKSRNSNSIWWPRCLGSHRNRQRWQQLWQPGSARKCICSSGAWTFTRSVEHPRKFIKSRIFYQCR